MDYHVAWQAAIEELQRKLQEKQADEEELRAEATRVSRRDKTGGQMTAPSGIRIPECSFLQLCKRDIAQNLGHNLILDACSHLLSDFRTP